MVIIYIIKLAAKYRIELDGEDVIGIIAIVGFVEKTKILEMIQVTYKIDSTKTRTRELGGLAKGYAQFGCKNLMLISLNERGTEIYNKIPIKKVTIVDWLLGNVI